MEERLIVAGLNKSFEEKNGKVEVLNNINLTIKDGEFISILGSSGCGKSTLLRIIAGFDTSYQGKVLLDGEQINKPTLDKGMVFQDHRLLPWLTVRDNIAFGIPDKQIDKNELVQKHIDLVGLKGFENAFPHQLSGGMAQRAAIARALVNKPKILLLDEPFGALDAMTRINMQEEILRIWKQENITIILVTHDIEEAVYLGDRVVVLTSRPGKIKKIVKLEIGRPRDRVSNDFVKEKGKIYHEFFKQVSEPFTFTI
ncbi:MAG TPA: ABC transporter ATP-binding protein [Clostridium sp.]